MSSRVKRQGTLRFHSEVQSGRDSIDQFLYIYNELTLRFKARAASNGAISEQLSNPQYETSPFAVLLTFYERQNQSPAENFSKVLANFFDKLLTVAKGIPGQIGLAANLIEALKKIVSEDKESPTINETRRVVSGPGHQVNWQDIQKFVQSWRDGHLRNINESDWNTLRDLLLKGSKNEANPQAPTKEGEENADNRSDQTEQPGGDHSVDKNQSRQLQTDLLYLTQLTGRLVHLNDEFVFEVDGFLRFDSSESAVVGLARLDVLGPDGSSLLTDHIDSARLEGWLHDEEAALEVDVAWNAEFASAIDRQIGQLQPRKKFVKGRIWFSDGQASGIRTVAILPPAKRDRLISPECLPEALLSDSEDCCCDQPNMDLPLLLMPQAIAVAYTDEAGYFEFPLPNEDQLKQFVMFRISGVRLPILYELSKNSPPDQQHNPFWFFPEQVLLHVDSGLLVEADALAKQIDWLGNGESECDCKGTDISRPNRTLDEFKSDIIVRTTDPMIIRTRIARGAGEDAFLTDGVFARYLKVGDRNTAEQAQQYASEAPLGSAPVDRFFRAKLSVREAIEWDDAPTIAQAVTISHGRILTIKQEWRSDGYSIGDLRYSLPLAPLQKKNIAVIDWGRNNVDSLDASQDNRESINNYLSRERDISEIMNSAANETIRGRSDSGSSSRSGGGGLSLFGIGFGGASAGSVSAWSSSSQDSAKSVSANLMNQLRDQVVQAANSVRSQRVTSVRQVSETETARAVTETVANRNACHAITIQYYEVLRHFKVTSELSSVRECLFIPLPISPFDEKKALRWQTILGEYLPTQELRRGLSAMRRLDAPNYPGPMGTYADELLQRVVGEFDLVLDFSYPAEKIQDGVTWDSFFGSKFTNPAPLPTLFQKLKDTSEPQRIELFSSQIAPVLAEKFVQSLRLKGELDDGSTVEIPAFVKLTSSYKPGAQHLASVRMPVMMEDQSIKRKQLISVIVYSAVTISSSNSLSVQAARIQTETKSARPVQFSRGFADGVINGSNDIIRIPTPLSTIEQTRPKEDDELLQKNLVTHLNEYLEFYHKAIWWNMDVDRRFGLLDSYIAPNSGGRSVASVVENRLVGIVGNSLVMPVAAGIRLDYYSERPEKEGDTPAAESLLSVYKPEIEIPPTRISVPTRGVFAESVMGSCNSCEKIDDRRNWKYWEHPLPDEPTAILPPSLESRSSPQPATVPPLAPSIINQVASSLPAAPDPGSLSSVLNALANGAIFRDATGLSGTQENARDALGQTFTTTKRFGELGAEITMKQIDAAMEAMKAVVSAYTGVPLPSSGSKVKEEIRQDAAAGRITKEQAQAAIAKVNDAMASSVGVSASKEPLEHPEVLSALREAVSGGAPISVSQGRSKVDIGESGGITRDVPRRTGLLGRLMRNPASGRKPGGPITDRQKMLPTMTFEIVTEIRDTPAIRAKGWNIGRYAPGEKSRQTIKFDPNTGSVINQFVPGRTWGFIPSVHDLSEAQLDHFDMGTAMLWARAQTATGVAGGLAPDIDYFFRFFVNFEHRKLSIRGEHDAFPSYAIFLDGRSIYDKEQSANLTDLFGTANDIKVVEERGF